MPRKFYRTLFQIEVLSEEPYPSDADLEDINNDTSTGPCVGELRYISTEELNGKQAADALYAIRSDPGFFELDDNGNDLEESNSGDEVCPKCGTRIDRAHAFVDEGTGPEAGRTFYYCSERCRRTH